MTDTRKFEKMPILTGWGTGICCIWRAVYKKDAALQARQHGFANVSRQPISTGEREAYFLDPLHLWLFWWDQTTYGLLYQWRLSIQALGLCWACSALIAWCLIIYVNQFGLLSWWDAAVGAGAQVCSHVSPAVLPWVSHQIFCWFWDTPLLGEDVASLAMDVIR